MNGLGLNIVIARLEAGSSQYANRMAGLRSDVAAALEGVEALVRAEALGAGIAESDLEEHAGAAVGAVVRHAVEGVLAEARSARRARQAAPPAPAGHDTPHRDTGFAHPTG